MTKGNFVFFLPFCLTKKEAKKSRPKPSASPRSSKGLILRSRSAFFECKRQAPLREGQAFSRPLRPLPRVLAVACAPSPVCLWRTRYCRLRQACHPCGGYAGKGVGSMAEELFFCWRPSSFWPCLPARPGEGRRSQSERLTLESLRPHRGRRPAISAIS